MVVLADQTEHSIKGTIADLTNNFPQFSITNRSFIPALRGHLGVPDTVSEPLIVPLNYLVILHLIHVKSWDSKHMASEIECFHRYWNSAYQTPRHPLKILKLFKAYRVVGGQMDGLMKGNPTSPFCMKCCKQCTRVIPGVNITSEITSEITSAMISEIMFERKWHFGDHFGHEFGDDLRSDLRNCTTKLS